MTRQEAISRAINLVDTQLVKDSDYMVWCENHGISTPELAFIGKHDKDVSLRIYGDHATLITRSGMDSFYWA